MICHHPPIASFLMVSNDYRIYGTEEPAVSLSPNSLFGDIKGSIVIEFLKSKKKIYILTWPFIMYGTAIGERKVNCCGRGFAFEPESRLVCEIIFNPYENSMFDNLFNSEKSHKIDEIGGAIYRVKKPVMDKFMSCVPHSKTRSVKLAIDPSKDVEEFVS